jgi:hypothetical protein
MLVYYGVGSVTERRALLRLLPIRTGSPDLDFRTYTHKHINKITVVLVDGLNVEQ